MPLSMRLAANSAEQMPCNTFNWTSCGRYRHSRQSSGHRADLKLADITAIFAGVPLGSSVATGGRGGGGAMPPPLLYCPCSKRFLTHQLLSS